ncbi:MAG: carbamoyl phosphate synthase large subunit, partial [Planctomycetota bacterium]
MAGKSLDELGVQDPPPLKHTAVKEAVFPFSKFPGVDIILGPEMRSTGEVMGIDQTFPLAYFKAQLAAGTELPRAGTVFLSVRKADKQAAINLAKHLVKLDFALVTTAGTHDALAEAGIESQRINKIQDGRPNLKDMMADGKIHLVINTPTRKGPTTDEGKIRALTVRNRVPIITTMTAAFAAARAIESLQQGDWDVRALQEYFANPKSQ